MDYQKNEENLMNIIRSVVKEHKTDEAFYICDLSDVHRKYEHWKTMLPRVKPFYAVKANAEISFLRYLFSLGAGFDCASKDEIDWILNLGAFPSQIIYAHTFKMPSHLKHAKECGVDLMTFDSEEELLKIKEHFPNARLVIRFQVPNVISAYPLDDKFGCDISHCPHLLETARRLNLSVVGTCFHVGGLCKDLTAYARAIKMAKEIFNVAKDFGYEMNLLDIGGGFPGHSTCYEEFDEMCHSINTALEEYFPRGEGIEIIAEPGTYFSGSAFTLCMNILGKRRLKSRTGYGDKIAYYLNDGIYGSFFDGYENYQVGIIPLQTNLEPGQQRPSTAAKLWGYTCCPQDLIKEDCFLSEMEVGEYLIFRNMGAYTLSIISNFNGFPRPVVKFVFSDKKGNKNMQI